MGQTLAKVGVVVKGTLSIDAKPACAVQVDGAGSFHTPVQGLPLAPGRYRVTLTNTEYMIRETVTVEVAAGKDAVVERDFRDRITPKVEPKIDPKTEPKADPPTDAAKPEDRPTNKDKTIDPFKKRP